MKKNIFKSLFMSVLCILAVSCEDTDDFVNTLDTNKTQIMFSIGMDSPIARSRATWGEDYNPSDGGDAYDNRINPDQLYVKITHEGQTYDVKKILKWQDKDNLSSHTFVGEVDIDLKGQTKTMVDARIEVFANWNPEANNGDVFGQNAEYIPMWGVQTATITLAPGKRETLSSIYLLRAMAKLQVNLNKEMFNEYALKSVTLNKHNATGNCYPAGASAAANTRELGLEEVLNAKKDAEQSALQLPVAVEDSMYVVYLPEVENDGETDEDLLKITVELAEKKDGKVTGNTEEGSFFVKDFTNPDDPVVMDIVRNHWYKYEIKGFAASEIQLNYTVVDWQNVGIEIGGDGFLFLNKDVIEIYNSNIDADQLKFSSSSPIKSITLKDSYKHYRNGEIKETPVGETADEVYAYYMNKFGVLTQLSSEEGTDEAVVLANISAEVKEENKKILNGGIVVNSPFMANAEAVETVLKNDSHYNTVRYLEFEVENEQELKATFRVMQYPPVVITNEEGYFSYRDDFRTFKDNDNIKNQNPEIFPEDIKDYGPVHYHNYHNPAWAFAGYYAYKVTECDPITEQPLSSTYYVNDYQYEELIYSSWKLAWHNVTTYPGAPNAIFHRDHFHYKDGGAFPSSTNDTEYRSDLYYQALGPLYQEDGKNLRRHYTGNLFEFFTPKVVDQVFTKDEVIEVEAGEPIYYCRYCTRYENPQAKPYILVENCKYPTSSNHKKQHMTAYIVGKGTMTFKKGQAAIYMITSNDDYDGWEYTSNSYVLNPNLRRMPANYNYFENPSSNLALKRPSYFNHRMYTIRTSVATNDYVLGYPELVDINGNSTTDKDRGVTADTEANARMVSPAFMVASQLGETIQPKDEYHYQALGAEGLLYYAKRQCQEYVETTYEDLNNNYKWDSNEPVKHYRGWRLPTEAELKLILKYQEESPTMDELLTGKNYFCAKPAPSYVTLDGESGKEFGFHMRCVRDIKGDENVTVIKK